MRALIVTVGFLVVVGVAAAAAPQPTTIAHTPAPVEALAQDGGFLAWLGGDGKQCNSVHLSVGENSFVLPQPANGSMTCHWALSPGAEHLALAAGASAALWTLHESRTDFVLTAQLGGREIEVDRLAHVDGTGWWLGGIAGGGNALAYSAVDVGYVDPLGCGSGGSCKKKITGGGISLVASGQKTSLPGAGPALGLAVSNGRVAYIQATTVTKGGIPTSSSSSSLQIRDVPSGALLTQAKPLGIPLAVGLSPHVLGVLSRYARSLRLTWYDPATSEKLGGVRVPLSTSALAVNDQFIVYRFGRSLRAVVLATRHVHALGQTALQSLGLSLDQGRLVWAENHSSYGLIRALPIH